MSRLGVAVTAVMLLVVSVPAHAQHTDAVTDSSIDTAAVQAAAPPQAASVMAPVGLQRQQATAQQPAMAATGTTAGQSEAMMAVGAGAIILGAIIGGQAGTIFMVGGGVLGLYGLWKYMQ
jgi:hypothetical protein